MDVKVSWENLDNTEFYNKLDLAAFKANSVRAGLQDCMDVEQVKEYLINADSVLEIGAGYGRVLEHLVKHKYGNHIYAIERSPRLCQLLRKNFGDNVKLFEESVTTFQSDQKFDVILWLFCSISDFSKNEQLPVLSNLAKNLKPDGHLILETLQDADEIKDVFHIKKQEHVFNIDQYLLHVYVPTPREFVEYGKKLGFTNVKPIYYETPSHIKRVIYVFSK
jgi:SAM-dependent methyltransferase